MDNRSDVLEITDASLIRTSGMFHSADTPEISVALESNGLSPLSSSLDHTLTLQEDKLLSSEINMGIEDTWTSEVSGSTSDFAIPLPAPSGLSEFVVVGDDLIGDSMAGLEHRPFLPTTVTQTMNNIFAPEHDDSHEDLPMGVCGLHNLGNTCFMAAGLQCLTATSPVLRHFLDLQQKGEKFPPTGSLMAHFSILLGKMWSGRYSVLRPTEFKQTLGTYHSQFKDYRQHDCQEFLALLLDSLHEQMNSAKCNTTRHLPTSVSETEIFEAENPDMEESFPVTALGNLNYNMDTPKTHNSSSSLECPNSPSIIVAGSPRDLDSPRGEIGNIINSLKGSRTNDSNAESGINKKFTVNTIKESDDNVCNNGNDNDGDTDRHDDDDQKNENQNENGDDNHENNHGDSDNAEENISNESNDNDNDNLDGTNMNKVCAKKDVNLHRHKSKRNGNDDQDGRCNEEDDNHDDDDDNDGDDGHDEDDEDDDDDNNADDDDDNDDRNNDDNDNDYGDNGDADDGDDDEDDDDDDDDDDGDDDEDDDNDNEDNDDDDEDEDNSSNENDENGDEGDCSNDSNRIPRHHDFDHKKDINHVGEYKNHGYIDDEETLDSDEIVGGTGTTFIRNKVNGAAINDTILSRQRSLRLNTLIELSKGVSTYDRIYDIHKEAKTSNANFLVTQQACNNEIHYDSQKFPRENVRRMPLDNSNLTENHDFDNKSVSVKRIKEVNIEKVNRRVECTSSGSDLEYDSGLEKCNVKRMKLDDQEKNHKRDVSRGTEDIRCLQKSHHNHRKNSVVQVVEEEMEADKHWAKHLRRNRSVIVDTFQGQFKSTVVCAECNHVSVTYEPFMYLSVPLPHAMERQLTVTYVPANGHQPLRCVASLNKQSRVAKLKEEVLKTLGKDREIAVENVALAEVLENHIAKVLDDNTLLRHVNDTNRSVYAFELMEPPDAYTPPASDLSGDDCHRSELESHHQRCTIPGEEVPCTICLEELDGGLKRHNIDNCSFVMCDSCIENYFRSQTEPQTCPMCSKHMTASSFTKMDQTGRPRPAVRILCVPLVLRHDTTNETTNNRKATKLFGYPRLVRLPSRVNAKDLYDVVKGNVPQAESCSIHLVDGQGHHCSRCMYTAHCTGCSVPKNGTIALQNGDTLAVRYTGHVPKILQPADHVSVKKQRPLHPLSLYDCLRAFSESETLDEHNPWFCPKCERNRCATKTLAVHRYPKFLIVYLKRFVFYERASIKLDDKVTFPLVGLSVGRHLYDLYACVCHFGGVSAGHYTAYAKNPRTDVWYHYNDEITSRQKPQDEDFSNAYILFYSRQGNSSKSCNI